MTCGPATGSTGQDDAKAAEWVPASTFDEIRDHLAVDGGQLFPAHVDMVKAAVLLATNG